jgi:hypothetical protein
MQYVSSLPLYTVKDSAMIKERDNLLTDINAYVNKWASDFVTGAKTFDQWGEYVNGFADLKADRLVEIEQQALDAYYQEIGK